jgi:hypothetical protein
MDDKERYQRGMSRRRKILGEAWVDRAEANKTAFNADFQDFITRYWFDADASLCDCVGIEP